VFAAAYRLSVGATGHISTLPVPLYTFTSPSPLTAEPASDLVVRSTVNSREEVQQTARLPSILSSSLSSSTSISSSAGTLLSKTATPLPARLKLNSPSPPATAEEILERAVILRCTVPSQARNIPSSTVMPHPHSDTSCKTINL